MPHDRYTLLIKWNITHVSSSFTLIQWFSIRSDFTFSWYLAIFGYIFGCHKWGGVLLASRGQGATKRLTTHRTVTQMKKASYPKCKQCWGWEAVPKFLLNSSIVRVFLITFRKCNAILTKHLLFTHSFHGNLLRACRWPGTEQWKHHAVSGSLPWWSPVSQRAKQAQRK